MNHRMALYAANPWHDLCFLLLRYRDPASSHQYVTYPAPALCPPLPTRAPRPGRPGVPLTQSP